MAEFNKSVRTISGDQQRYIIHNSKVDHTTVKNGSSFIINSQSEDPPNYFRKHQVHKRQVTVGGVAAAMAVLYDLETALRNTSTVIEEFQEASTVKNLNITLEDSPPDITSINETLEQLEDGNKTLNLPNFM